MYNALMVDYRRNFVPGGTDYHRHLDYIHYNPVKHGLAKHPGEWPHSSYHKYFKKQWYTPGWGKNEPELEGKLGE
ncbi:MAG: hypothetical protein ABIR48_02585 [Gammaproteobacteria bacterium]